VGALGAATSTQWAATRPPYTCRIVLAAQRARVLQSPATDLSAEAQSAKAEARILGCKPKQSGGVSFPIRYSLFATRYLNK